MKTLIEVPAYISNSTYFFEEENSRSYICNEKTHREFLLEGVYSDVWKVILDSQNYKKSEEYAKLRGLENGFEEFIQELKILGFIGNNLPLEVKQDGIPESESDEAENELTLEKQKWMIDNNLLNELVLELSYKCNLFCKHCYNDKDDQKTEIDFETAKKIVDDAQALGVCSIYISSGECTINKNFLKIIEYIRSKRISFTFASNGQELYDNKELLDKIIKLSPHRIKLSLYSMNPNVHDNITGVKGSCIKTIEVIKKLRKNNVLVTINFFQLCLNKDSINDIIKFRDEIGASLSVDVFFLNNKNNNNADVQADDEQLYSLYKEGGICSNIVGRKNRWSSSTEDALVCHNMKTMLSVSPSLDVFPCLSFKYKLGNLKETTLEKIYNNSLNDFMKIFKIKNLEDCKNCENFEYCVYCPAMAMYENGFLKKSDICCHLTKLRMDVLKHKILNKNL